jgi:tetratricopeptide (TPR) repeat protein
LPPREKQLLQAASVIGKDVPYAILQGLVDAPEEALRTSLARLQSAEFLYEASLFPALEYTFKHALTHEVAYGGLLHDRRTALHAQIMRAIDRLAGARWPEHAETLAHHAVRGEVWDRGVDALLEASRRAWGRGAISECLRHLEQARELLLRLPAGSDTTRRAVDVRAQLYLPLVAVGQLVRADELLREAEALARELDDQPRLGFVLSRLGVGALMAGRYAEALDRGRRGLAIGTATGDADLRIRASYLVGFAHLARGEIGRAFEFLTPLADGPDRDGARRLVGLFGDLYVSSCGWLAYACVMLGDFERAFTYGDRAVEAADSSDIAQSRAYAHAIRGFASVVFGEPTVALPWLERAVEIAERQGAVYWLSIAQLWRGRALALAGRAAESLKAIEQAMALRQRIGTQAVAAMAAGAQAEVLLVAGRVEEAGRRRSGARGGRGAGRAAVRGTRARIEGRHRERRARTRHRAGPGALRARDPARARARRAPCGGAGPSRSRAALSRQRRPGEGRRAPGEGGGDVPRDGHDLLAERGGGGAGTAQTEVNLNRVALLH